MNTKELSPICRQVRRDIITMTANAGSGHPGQKELNQPHGNMIILKKCRQRPSRRLPFGRRADDQRFLQPHAR